MVVDYGFYKRVVEFVVNYLGLSNRLLRINVIEYSETINGTKVLVSVESLGGDVRKYCVILFDNVHGRAIPTCVDNPDEARRIYQST